MLKTTHVANLFYKCWPVLCLIFIYTVYIPLASSGSLKNPQLDLINYRVQRSINLEITTHLGDNQTFIAGDTLSFLVNLDHDAYLFVIYETADNKLIQLFPNQYAGNDVYQAGLFVQVPNNMLTKKFEIAPPFGKETVYAFASSEPFPEITGSPLDNGLFLITQSLSEVINGLRRRVDNRNVAYGENYLTIKTRQR